MKVLWSFLFRFPKNIPPCISLLLCCFLLAQPVYAQSKSDLEKKRARLLKEISETNKQLKQTSANKNKSQSEINALSKKIKARQELIGVMNREINGLNSQITQVGSDIGSLEREMTMLKNSYTEMLKFAQRNQNSYQMMMFIFASSSFNQAMKRMKYLHQISESRRTKATKIAETQSLLNQKKIELESNRSQKTNLRNDEESHKRVLDKEKKSQQVLLGRLQQNEKSLKKKLQEKQAAKAKLDKAIEAIVRKEIEAARKKAEAAGKKNVTNKNVFTLTPEARELSNSFAANKGRLPWPLESGKISQRFGTRPHPELKGVSITNNGIDLIAPTGSKARSVFNGEVTGVTSVAGNNVVIIRHGEYLSVYYNLDNVSVTKGQKISTKQSIGSILDNDQQQAELHLEIWKGFEKLDPGTWLAK